MVGIVIVSHSEKLAQGVVELAALMAPEAPMAAAGGMDDGGFGTSYEKIISAVEKVYSEDGAIVLMDMGSAVLTAEMVLEAMPERKIKMVDCPVVEGAVSASLAAAAGQSIEEVIDAAMQSKDYQKID